MQDQSATLEWHDGRVPVSTRFDDPYFSLDNGLEETRHVFLGGNNLPARFRDGFHVAELGFGTGLNLLATWEAWRQADAPGRLRFTSFEAFPMTLADMETALRAFPQMEALARALLDALGGAGPVFDLGDVELTLITGDARQALPAWDGRADAWFLDGFSPA
ncbi:MAG: tRNA (5-methylaminomethyl-2-thiouridine)(34)-methyltransferase MnmD, partial [Pseudomonadota bacterium]